MRRLQGIRPLHSHRWKRAQQQHQRKRQADAGDHHHDAVFRFVHGVFLKLPRRSFQEMARCFAESVSRRRVHSEQKHVHGLRLQLPRRSSGRRGGPTRATEWLSLRRKRGGGVLRSLSAGTLAFGDGVGGRVRGCDRLLRQTDDGDCPRRRLRRPCIFGIELIEFRHPENGGPSLPHLLAQGEAQRVEGRGRGQGYGVTCSNFFRGSS